MRRFIPMRIKHHPLVASVYNDYLDRRNRRLASYIFVATSGRSGTLTLREIFAAIDDCVAYHEPAPKMVHDAPAGAIPSEYYRELFYRHKTINIKRAAVGFRYYVEVNHLFAKTFGEHAIAYFGRKLKVIHLVRDPQSVARSIYALNEVPGTTQVSRWYWLDPEERHNVLDLKNILGIPVDAIHPFHKCLWYWYECEARIFLLKERFPDAFKFLVTTNDLNDWDRVKRMLEALDLEYSEDKIRKLVGTRKNIRTSEKGEGIDRREANLLAIDFHNAVKQYVTGPLREHYENCFIFE